MSYSRDESPNPAHFGVGEASVDRGLASDNGGSGFGFAGIPPSISPSLPGAGTGNATGCENSAVPSPDRGMVLSEHILRSGDDDEFNHEVKVPPPALEEDAAFAPRPVAIEQGGELFVKRKLPLVKGDGDTKNTIGGNATSATSLGGGNKYAAIGGERSALTSSSSQAPPKNNRTSIIAGGASSSVAVHDENDEFVARQPPTATAATSSALGSKSSAGGVTKGLASVASKYRANGGGSSSNTNTTPTAVPPYSPAEGARDAGTTTPRKKGGKADSAPAELSPQVITAPRVRAARGPSEQATFNTQRHAIWRQHIDRLYDFYAQHFLEYPTSTIAFVPESRVRFPAEYAMHQIYTGTVAPPTSGASGGGGAGALGRGGGAANSGSLKNSSNNNFVCAYHCYVPSEIEEEDREEGDEDLERRTGEVGKYVDVANILQPVLKVAHDGPVQRIRVNPFIPSLIASRGRKNNLSVYQLADYGVDDTYKPPTTTLRGPRQAGHGLAWHPDEQQLLAASANDGMVFVYDVNANIEVTAAGDEEDNRRIGSSTGPIMGLVGHQDIAFDVSWHPTQTHTLMSCDAQGKVIFWDTRSMSKEFSAEVHLGPALSCAYHPTGIFAFATTGADGLVRIWDYRKLNRPTYNLVGHRGSVLGVKWAPFNNAVLLSHSADGSVILWDLAKADSKPVEGLDDYMRPEMTFQHFGHMGPVRDAQWCDHPEDPWTVASVDDHNTVQLWSPAPNTYNNIRPDEEE